MILISHLNFTTKRERIPYILAFFESCLLEYLKSQVDVDKSTETQVIFILTYLYLLCYTKQELTRRVQIRFNRNRHFYDLYCTGF